MYNKLNVQNIAKLVLCSNILVLFFFGKDIYKRVALSCCVYSNLRPRSSKDQLEIFIAIASQASLLLYLFDVRSQIGQGQSKI